jgi:hypothetical protein
VDIVTGRKFEYVQDFAHAMLPELQLQRTYNQAWAGAGVLGRFWVTNFDLKLSTARWWHAGTPTSANCYPTPGVAALHAESVGAGAVRASRRRRGWWSSRGTPPRRRGSARTSTPGRASCARPMARSVCRGRMAPTSRTAPTGLSPRG